MTTTWRPKPDWRDCLGPPTSPDRGDLDPDEARAEGEALAAERNDDVGEAAQLRRQRRSRQGREDLQPADLEPDGLEPDSDDNLDIEALGYDEERKPVADARDPHVEDQLDPRGWTDTFPASDPVSINPGRRTSC